ncbi:MAG: hypothetical protein RXQ00_00600 [Caldivirga sp.]
MALKTGYTTTIEFSVGVGLSRAAFIVGSFTAFMKPLELEFCGDSYCTSLPPVGTCTGMR